MTVQKPVFVQTVFWSTCVVISVWALVTLCIEFNLGWPADRAAWGHRSIGWFVNFILIRTFLRLVKRYYAVRV